MDAILANQPTMSKDNDKAKKVKEAKAYKLKLKRHKDAVLSIYSQDGINGQFLISGSADHTCRSKYNFNLIFILFYFYYSLGLKSCQID